MKLQHFTAVTSVLIFLFVLRVMFRVYVYWSRSDTYPVFRTRFSSTQVIMLEYFARNRGWRLPQSVVRWSGCRISWPVLVQPSPRDPKQPKVDVFTYPGNLKTSSHSIEFRPQKKTAKICYYVMILKLREQWQRNGARLQVPIWMFNWMMCIQKCHSFAIRTAQ